MRFPLIFTPDDDGTLSVTCQTLPEVTAQGGSLDEALGDARSAIVSAIGARIRGAQAVPDPIHRGGPAVTLPAVMAVKIALHNAMVGKGMKRGDFARHLGVGARHVDDLLDLGHGSRLDQLETAFLAIGQSLEIRTVAKAS